MAAPRVTDCQIDAERLGPVAGAAYDYRLPGASDPDWPHNTLSIRTVAYSCGALGRAGEPLWHDHDPAELDLCRHLSAEAAATMAGCEIGMGSEGGGSFLPFFVATNAGVPAPADLTEGFIRRALGGTIYPAAQVVVEPLEERGRWWESVTNDCGGSDDPEEALRPWRAMMRWFHGAGGLHAGSFVMIGETPLGGPNAGCVHPRLALALTEAGSLVGIGGCVVHT
jgi:hypothetical protein